MSCIGCTMTSCPFDCDGDRAALQPATEARLRARVEDLREGLQHILDYALRHRASGKCFHCVAMMTLDDDDAAASHDGSGSLQPARDQSLSASDRAIAELREALRSVLMDMEHVLHALVGRRTLTPQQVMDLGRGIKTARVALGMEATE